MIVDMSTIYSAGLHLPNLEKINLGYFYKRRVHDTAREQFPFWNP